MISTDIARCTLRCACNLTATPLCSSADPPGEVFDLPDSRAQKVHRNIVGSSPTETRDTGHNL